MTVFCVNCEHCTASTPDKYGYIDYYCDQWLNLVTGETYKMDASSMRIKGNRCGPDGVLFVRKKSHDKYRTDIPDLT
jgi:hypothetical protein